MKAFWIDSTNLTTLTGLKNALTELLLTDDDVASITGQLYDDDDVAVGSSFAFAYDAPGEWHASWEATMVEDAFYTLEVTIVGTGLNLTIQQRLPARYRGPEDT